MKKIVFLGLLLLPLSVSAGVNHPYIVDEKPQILFGDSAPITVGTTTYLGLENYKHDYVGGYAHITFTYTHHVCCFAGYPPRIYVTDIDPQSTTTASMEKTSAGTFNIPSGINTGWYLYDIQFDANGYNIFVQEATTTNIIYQYHQDIPNLADTDWVSLANLYPLQDPIQPYSMSFTPFPVRDGPQAPKVDSVLFIPGFMASDLYVQGSFSENQLWPPTSLLKADVVKLMLDSSGNPVTPGIYTKSAIKEVFGFNIYKSFFNKMDDAVASGDIHEWEAFPYDWRRDIPTVVSQDTVVKVGNNFENKKLIDEAIALALRSPTGKIDIIGHSNGGLVGKALIRELTAQGKAGIVDQFIMVATPQLGTPKAIGGLLHGDEQKIPSLVGLFMNKDLARQLGYNMQSAYNLLPSEAYFSSVSDPVIKFEDSINSIFDYGSNGLTQSVSSFSGMSTFLTLSNRGDTQSASIDIPSVLRSDLISNANTYVGTLASWVVPSSIKVSELAGWGVSTTKGVNYMAKQENVCTSQAGLYVCKPQSNWNRRLLKTQDGDGTVVVPSATQYSTPNEYYFNLFNYNNNGFDLDHSNILESSQVLDLISQITKKVVDNNSLPAYISTVKPVSTSQSLQLSIHSPVSLGVTDVQGRYTGISSTTPTDAFTFVKEEIPNSYYTELGEDKYIGLPEGSNYTVVLQGTGVGSFTFDQVVSQGDTVVASKSFIDIPVTPLTKATLSVSANSLAPSLNLDTDGDGVVDVQVQAGDQFDPVAYLTVMKSVIKSFNLKKSDEKNLVDKIDNLIKLIAKGKIPKASIKAEAYVSKLNSKLEKTSEERKGRKGNNKLTQVEIQTIIQGLEELINNLK